MTQSRPERVQQSGLQRCPLRSISRLLYQTVFDADRWQCADPVLPCQRTSVSASSEARVGPYVDEAAIAIVGLPFGGCDIDATVR